jgi:hypothetical protein
MPPVTKVKLAQCSVQRALFTSLIGLLQTVEGVSATTIEQFFRTRFCEKWGRRDKNPSHVFDGFFCIAHTETGRHNTDWRVNCRGDLRRQEQTGRRP